MKNPLFLIAAILPCLTASGTALYARAQAQEAAPPMVPTTAAGKARNVVLMIGDGMGAEHVWAAWLANKGALNITNLPVTGFSITMSASHTITDSAAGGTAIACGCKAINKQVGLDAAGNPRDSLAVQMRRAGKSTGLVGAGFEVLIGGGAGDFTAEQKENLRKNTQLFELAADKHCPPASVRGNWLPERVSTALQTLERDPDGFFLMVEGSRIDTSAHENDLPETVRETLDFDRAVGVVLEWMKKHPDTLLVVTADHQTGGFCLLDGDKKKGEVKGRFTTFDHSGVAVPVYAAGPGAERFTGVQENSALAPKIHAAAGIHP